MCVIHNKLNYIYIYETGFSRLRTQGPQTPGKLHEPKLKYLSENKYNNQATYTSVIPIYGQIDKYVVH